MQGSLLLPKRLSLQSLAALQSHGTIGIKTVGLCSFPRGQALGKPGANNGVANDLQTVTVKIVAFAGNTNMKGAYFANTPSCLYKIEVTPSRFSWTSAASGKSCRSAEKSSCGILKPVQLHTALQWLSLCTQREYARKPAVRVAGKTGGQEVLLKEEEFEFKRIVSESDSITTFYSSDASSYSNDEDDEKQTKAAQAYAEDSDSESDNDGGRGTDHKEAKEGKFLQKTEISKIEMRRLGKCEDSDSESVDEQEKTLMKEGERVGKCEGSDGENEDEEEILTKDVKKIAKAEFKQKEKLEKESTKAMKKYEKKQKKEATKLDYDGKKDDESDSDSENDKEGEQNLREKTKTITKLEAGEDLASDSEYEEADDGVIDFGDDDLDKENSITEEEIEGDVEEIDISNEIEDELDDIDEDDRFWDDDEGDVAVGDGGTGGGVVLGGTKWGTKALELAEQVVAECGKDLSIFAFKVSSDRVIRARLDKLSGRYGSPTMTDIENFSRKFSIVLEESGEAGALPKDIDVEVSSPGAERVVRVPDDLERFKELPMYVQYLEGETDQDGVFELDSVDMDTCLSVWKIANVKLNREVKGRGRPLNSKQKKWRATVPFTSLKQVRLYLDV